MEICPLATLVTSGRQEGRLGGHENGIVGPACHQVQQSGEQVLHLLWEKQNRIWSGKCGEIGPEKMKVAELALLLSVCYFG